MLTIFAIPKAFEGHINVIQRNAIKSWTLLKPRPEIILFGNEEDMGGVAHELGIRHVPEIRRNSYGTPFLDSVFKQAQKLAGRETLCYVNSDIILTQGVMHTMRRISLKDFLIVGQRWNIDMKENLDFKEPDWQKQLIRYVNKHGEIAPYDAIDYFLFPRESGLVNMPPFLVGRPSWDNWIIYRSLELGIPVIDATKDIAAIHQNHDRTPGVRSEEERRWVGPESAWNNDLAGDNKRFINHANYIMFSGFVIPLRIYRLLRVIYNSVFLRF